MPAHAPVPVVLDVVQQAASMVPVPFLQPLCQMFKTIWTHVELIKTNKRQMKAIAQAVAQIFVALNSRAVVADSESTLEYESEGMRQCRDDFEQVLARIMDLCERMVKKKILKSFLDANSDQDEIKAIHIQLSLSCDAFQISSQVGMQGFVTRFEAARQQDQAETDEALKQLLNKQSRLLGLIGEPEVGTTSPTNTDDQNRDDGSAETRNTVFGLLEGIHRSLTETGSSTNQNHEAAPLQNVIGIQNTSTERFLRPSVHPNPIIAHLKPGVKPEDLINPLRATGRMRKYTWHVGILARLTPKQQYDFEYLLDSSKLFVEHLVSCDDLALQYAALGLFQQDKDVKHFFKKKLLYAPSDNKNPILAYLMPGLEPSTLIPPLKSNWDWHSKSYTFEDITLHLSREQIGSFFCDGFDGCSRYIEHLVETDNAALQYSALAVFRRDKRVSYYFLPEIEDSE